MKLLLILFSIYLGIRLFARYVLPGLMKWFLQYIGQKAQENMRSQGFNPQGFGRPSEEPVSGNEKVTIKKSYTEKPHSKSMDDVGDYVDFEEVE
tara:strand:+ start:6332 stop:6613 length:282 start_codon:yes stop_codon:yes gene_type:complete